MREHAQKGHEQDTSDQRIRAQLDHLPCATALLDREGSILAVNGAWHRFAAENGADERTAAGVGLNYLQVCRGEDGAASLYEGLASLLNGQRKTFEQIYPCHSPSEMRWYRVSARACDESGPAGYAATVTHVDVTDYYLANARYRIQATAAREIASHARLLDRCRELALAVCRELDFDYAGVWTVDTATGTLRCRETWSRPGSDVSVFERASREAALAAGSGLPGRTWLTGKVHCVTDFETQEPPVAVAGLGNRIMPPSALAVGFRSAIAFPVKFEDNVLAVVDLFSRLRRSPDEALVELLETTGKQLALCEMREHAEELARAAKREADDARAQLASVLDCAPALVLVIDRENKIQFINHTSRQRRKEEVLGASWKHFVHPKEHAAADAALSAVFAGAGAQTYETAYVDESGRQRWFLNRMGPIRRGAAIVGAVVIAQDITETKTAQAELLDAQRLATVGTLAAGVAHEINTPVQFVNDSIHFLRDAVKDAYQLLGALRSLKEGVINGVEADELHKLAARAEEVEEEADLPYLLENIPRAFDRSIDGLERVTTIVRSMKEFAHPSQKEMAWGDLNRAIQATLTVGRNEYKYVADVAVELGAIPPVNCHVSEISQVVLNIVVNAAHAIEDVVRGTESKGLIRVSTRVDGEDVVIAISDTGGGIPEAVRGRIFDPFFTTKEVGRGTGQGLAMARTTVREKHGGELTFDTEMGKGTTFFIRLPIQGKKLSVRGAA